MNNRSNDHLLNIDPWTQNKSYLLLKRFGLVKTWCMYFTLEGKYMT